MGMLSNVISELFGPSTYEIEKAKEKRFYHFDSKHPDGCGINTVLSCILSGVDKLSKNKCSSCGKDSFSISTDYYIDNGVVKYTVTAKCKNCGNTIIIYDGSIVLK